MEVSIFSISKNLSYPGGFSEVKRGKKMCQKNTYLLSTYLPRNEC